MGCGSSSTARQPPRAQPVFVPVQGVPVQGQPAAHYYYVQGQPQGGVVHYIPPQHVAGRGPGPTVFVARRPMPQQQQQHQPQRILFQHQQQSAAQQRGPRGDGEPREEACIEYLLGACRAGARCTHPHPPGLRGVLREVSQPPRPQPAERMQPRGGSQRRDEDEAALQMALDASAREEEERAIREALSESAAAAREQQERELQGNSRGGGQSRASPPRQRNTTRQVALGGGKAVFYSEFSFVGSGDAPPGGNNGEGSDDAALSCDICMEDYTDGDRVGAVACLHKFHSACLQQWLQKQPRCPTCNMDVTEDLSS